MGDIWYWYEASVIYNNCLWLLCVDIYRFIPCMDSPYSQLYKLFSLIDYKKACNSIQYYIVLPVSGKTDFVNNCTLLTDKKPTTCEKSMSFVATYSRTIVWNDIFILDFVVAYIYLLINSFRKKRCRLLKVSNVLQMSFWWSLMVLYLFKTCLLNHVGWHDVFFWAPQSLMGFWSLSPKRRQTFLWCYKANLYPLCW